MAIRASEKMIAAISRYQAGDETAFDTVYYESLPYITRCVLNVVNKTVSGASEDVVQDIIQETYMIVATKLNSLQNPVSFLQWAGQIATHLAEKTWVRDSRRYQMEMPEEELLYEPIDESFIPEDILQNREAQRIIRQILEELPTAQYLCVVEYFYNGLKEVQVAKKLSMPLNTVKTNLRRAKQKIKDSVLSTEKKHGIRLHSMAWLLWIYFLQDLRKTAVDPAQQSQMLVNIKDGLAKGGIGAAAAAAAEAADATVAAGSTAAAAAGGSAAAGTVSGGAGILAGIGAKIVALTLAIAVTVGGAVGVSKLVGGGEELPGSQISENPENIPPVADELDLFHVYFTPAGDELVTILDCATGRNGSFCRRPYVRETLQGSQSVNARILATTKLAADSIRIHDLSDYSDIRYRGQMIHGWLYLEDMNGSLPSLAVDALTGDVCTAGDLYELYQRAGGANRSTLAGAAEELYRSRMETLGQPYMEEGLSLTLEENNLLRASFAFDTDADGKNVCLFCIPLLGQDGRILEYAVFSVLLPDNQLVSDRNSGMLPGGRNAYRIPYLHLDSDYARELNAYFASMAEYGQWDECYFLNYRTWLSGRYLVLEFRVEILGSNSTKTYYLDILTGEEVTQEHILEHVGLTTDELAEKIRPAVQDDYRKKQEQTGLAAFPEELYQLTCSVENLSKASVVLKDDGQVLARYNVYEIAGSGRRDGYVPLISVDPEAENLLNSLISGNICPGLEQMLGEILAALSGEIANLDYAAWTHENYLLIALGSYDMEKNWMGYQAVCCDMRTGQLLPLEELLAMTELTPEIFERVLRNYLFNLAEPPVDSPAEQTAPGWEDLISAEIPAVAPPKETGPAETNPLWTDPAGSPDAILAAETAVYWAEEYWGLEHGKYYGDADDLSDGISILCDGFFRDSQLVDYYTFRLTMMDPAAGGIITVDTVHITSPHGTVYTPR